MRWQRGQKFLLDEYNEWVDTYSWYLEIDDFTSSNDDGDISVDVDIKKYDGSGDSIGNVRVSASVIEQEVEDGNIEPIDELSEDQKTNIPETDREERDATA